MIRYKNIFLQNTTQPTQGTFTPKLWEVQKKAWFIKQKRVCILINNCLDYNSSKIVKGLNTIKKIITIDITHFWLSRSAIFTTLNH